jgi:hypothetical protein
LLHADFGQSSALRNWVVRLVVVTARRWPCWVLPANSTDPATSDGVQRDLSEWRHNWLVWLMDRGMTGRSQRAALGRGSRRRHARCAPPAAFAPRQGGVPAQEPSPHGHLTVGARRCTRSKLPQPSDFKGLHEGAAA